ncbi:MAG: TrkH family potassium uptake protein [Firmicutes bacterium]|nr:TrkH family potassium uptake protein [Bacillota bacterium]
MRIQRVFYSVGNLTLVMGAFMLIPLCCSLAYGENDWRAFALSVPIAWLIGGLLLLAGYPRRKQALRQRESYLFVSLSWMIAAFLGAFPFIFSGALTDFSSAFFESMSGFTTTGATVITDVESLPHGILLWRSLSHWLGGAGIVALFGMLIQKSSGSAGEISAFKAEYSGAALSERIMPRIRDHIRAICLVYLGLTFVFTVALYFAGMGLFDAVNHGFTVVATGGFSTKNTSIAWFHSNAVEWVCTLGMLASGVNLTLYAMLFRRHRRKRVLQTDELKYYILLCLIASLWIGWELYRADLSLAGGFVDSLRAASFQTVSLLTTTGLCSVNYDLWPQGGRIVLFLLMFCGACSGSTTASIKISQWMILFRTALAELKTMFHPQLFRQVFFNGKLLSDRRINNTLVFFFLYFFTLFVGVVFLSLAGMSLENSFSGAVAILGNVGPAVGSIGPAGSYAGVPALGKWIFSFLMLAGRLEILTLLVLLVPGIWRRS